MIGILLLIGICVVVTVAILYAMYNKIKNSQNPSPNVNLPPPETRNTRFVNNLEKDHISSLYNLVKSSV
ncbi:IMV membrane-associated morphogenesis phosphoprotein [Variola virus]|uniref:Virion membrane protein OPG139 n=1 Tax=Variola virus TaxID=10255 RepID=Q89163_VARV|nr:IMV membrane-associated morphogenesis phosphoprotein [Variola virus]ABF29106.1 IMV membrane-associated morphogenesis phosphoprotein [Variola virus]CAA53886.1 unnamed protein product [Variola virus]CAB54717.1 A14L protein [Variola minor virus]